MDKHVFFWTGCLLEKKHNQWLLLFEQCAGLAPSRELKKLAATCNFRHDVMAKVDRVDRTRMTLPLDVAKKAKVTLQVSP